MEDDPAQSQIQRRQRVQTINEYAGARAYGEATFAAGVPATVSWSRLDARNACASSKSRTVCCDADSATSSPQDQLSIASQTAKWFLSLCRSSFSPFRSHSGKTISLLSDTTVLFTTSFMCTCSYSKRRGCCWASLFVQSENSARLRFRKTHPAQKM